MELSDREWRLLEALEDGMPLTAQPYAALGRRAGMGEGEVIETLSRMIEQGVIRRFGLVVRHRELGYRANGMVVWDIPDADIDRVAGLLAREAGVTLCYRRPRRLPDWPYNLFCMVHGRQRETVLADVAAMAARLGLDVYRWEILFSRRRFKQCGARYARPSAVENVA